MKKVSVILITILMLIILSQGICAKEVISVHCGAGLSPPMEKIGKLFEKKYNCKVEYSFKGSGCLLGDIIFSRRGDLYIPGEMFFMKQAVKRGFIKKYKKVGFWQTVIITPRNNSKKIKTLFDLAKPGMKVGLGDEKGVAVGKASCYVLKKAGIYDKVKKNQVMACLTVNELGVGVELGHLDAAIVWTSTASLLGKKCRIFLIPEKYSKTTEVPMGILTFAKNPRLAEKFLEFVVTSKEAKRVFRQNGYSTNIDELQKDLKRLEKNNR
ncbi:MAG: molybdate ABC transporter substrate-binding protein [Candidatus Eremiobacteraeota bacterium]|nr:molybdate ABC transporter substrate-binding protein [Candidatus Eremiobacteraeota bacterium]